MDASQCYTKTETVLSDGVDDDEAIVASETAAAGCNPVRVKSELGPLAFNRTISRLSVYRIAHT